MQEILFNEFIGMIITMPLNEYIETCMNTELKYKFTKIEDNKWERDVIGSGKVLHKCTVTMSYFKWYRDPNMKIKIFHKHC